MRSAAATLPAAQASGNVRDPGQGPIIVNP
jgi:hypothetical protein